jgi:uncharacterized protein (DUF433 family)
MSTATTSTGYAHITRPADGGEPTIDGMRLRVRDVVIARDFDGLSPEKIVELVYPFLTLGQVYAALAYYEDHREEIDAAERREAEVMEQFKRDHPDMVIDMRGE